MSVNDQQQRLDALLQPLPVTASLFPPSSRYAGYAGIGTAVLNAEGDRPIIYLRRRFVPQPERLAFIREHVVVAGERPDHVAASELGDPELFWRLCDANRTVWPADLVTEPGRRLRVAMAEGIPGVRDE